MNILVIGSGGREHALAWKLAQSDKIEEILIAPGSDAMAQMFDCRTLDIAESDHDALLQAAEDEDVELVIIGPEAPLVEGLADRFQEAGIPVFGPSKDAARLEGSKQFAKDIMKKYGIPTAAYETFTDTKSAAAYIRSQGAPIVVKADGLAAGKGVTVAQTVEEAVAAVEAALEGGAFGDAGRRVVVEEYLEGEELSLMALVHGRTVVPLDTAQDHKRAYEGDTGPNTGGMGAYSPVPHLDGDWTARAVEDILEPTAEALASEGILFTGVLYAGLMITEAGPKVIEYNVRFGDPEAQVVLPRLKTDLVELIQSVMADEPVEPEWSDMACAGVVLASEGYPGPYQKGTPFTMPMTRSDDVQQFFHAGTKVNSESVGWKTDGGRVLLLSSQAPSLEEAFQMTYDVLDQKEWNGLFYRKDIGRHLHSRQ
ncbi:phosphoribosylamine--glycine ligase [Alkalicoccus urumqiensis]|uniref:Phosphoribosylamine--glycine ligase n=1 Tax=Alkalicoccus urumqiensis TaxID=1548213 RepID=A0A2P6MIY6_ALKUR|nr:phosphoribosylamine--glycine ligase [Alkalicoccus urumqiensis]PRO66248.1 phosphoribosylamine--glycine ligase [Alkalicoccus urumqiensis]